MIQSAYELSTTSIPCATARYLQRVLAKYRRVWGSLVAYSFRKRDVVSSNLATLTNSGGMVSVAASALPAREARVRFLVPPQIQWPVAQLAERRSVKADVVGSKPAWPAQSGIV